MHARDAAAATASSQRILPKLVLVTDNSPPRRFVYNPAWAWDVFVEAAKKRVGGSLGDLDFKFSDDAGVLVEHTNELDEGMRLHMKETEDDDMIED